MHLKKIINCIVFQRGHPSSSCSFCSLGIGYAIVLTGAHCSATSDVADFVDFEIAYE